MEQGKASPLLNGTPARAAHQVDMMIARRARTSSLNDLRDDRFRVIDDVLHGPGCLADQNYGAVL